MRILLVTQFYPPVSGGQERHVKSLAQELSSRGHVVEVATIAARGVPGTVYDGAVPVHRIRSTAQRIPGMHRDADRPHTPPAVDPSLRRGLRRILSERSFDVLHAHDWSVDSAIGPARDSGVPVVLTLHDYSQVCATKRMMLFGDVCPGPAPGRCARCAASQYGRLAGPAVVIGNFVSSRRRVSAVSSFIAVSSGVASMSRLSGVDHEVIPNFIPDELVLDRPAPAAGDSLVLAGDLMLDKGVGTLLDAYRTLPAPPRLLLAGRVFPGTPRALPAGAELVGLVSHDEVMGLMRAAIAVIVPSIVLDPSPTVVLEAMACGRPVIAARSGGIPDLVEDGVTGLLVPPGDPVALAAALTDLIGDRGRAAEMGRRALVRVRKFTASTVVDRIEAVYERAMREYR